MAPSQRGREEERLAVGRGLGDDPVDRGLEAHVEHAVGLVEDEDADSLRARPTPRAIRSSSRPGVATTMSARRAAAIWGPKPDPAVDGGDAQPAGACDGLELVDDLARQLAGRRQDEGGEIRRTGLDTVHQRDAEGEGLAGAGRRLDEQVVTGERVADDHLLDGEGLRDAACGERVHHRFGDAEIGERHDDVGSFCLAIRGDPAAPKRSEAHGGNGTSRVAMSPSPTGGP